MSSESELLKNADPSTVGGVIGVALLLWSKVSSARAIKLSIAKLERQQETHREAVRLEMRHDFERLFDKLDENKRHYDERFAEVNGRIDLILKS